jgi:hypothetical protein
MGAKLRQMLRCGGEWDSDSAGLCRRLVHPSHHCRIWPTTRARCPGLDVMPGFPLDFGFHYRTHFPSYESVGSTSHTGEKQNVSIFVHFDLEHTE